MVEQLFTKKELYNLVNDALLIEAKTEVDFRHRLLVLATDFKMKAIHEKFDNLLKLVKTEYRKVFTNFVVQRQQELQIVIDEKRDYFLAKARQKAIECENLKDIAHIYKPLKLDLERETNEYILWLRNLMDNFMKVLEEKITEYKID